MRHDETPIPDSDVTGWHGDDHYTGGDWHVPDDIVRMHRRALRRKQLLSLRATLGCLTAFMIALSGWAVVLGLLLWRA